MNSTSNPNSSQPSGESQSQDTGGSQSSSQQGRCAFDPLCSAVNEGAHRAKAAAEKAIPKVKAAVADATYWFGFGVSFASVFSYTVVKELAPEVLKAGFRDGAQAGRRKAEDLTSKKEAPSPTPASATEASGATPEPGLA